MKDRRRPDADTQAQIILYAEVHGDEAACARFKITDRTLRNYRAEAREEGSELSETFRRYAAALDPDRRATDFAAWLTSQVQKVSAIIEAKAKDVDVRNPEGLRVLNEHAQTLLEHAAALQYIAGLFPPEPKPEGGGEG